MSDILSRLAETLESRKHADPASSYVARLYAKGLDAILKKIGEEATETVIAAKDGDRQQLVYEMADLWFHCMVLLASQGVRPDDVLDELARREGLSGLAEKAVRPGSLNGRIKEADMLDCIFCKIVNGPDSQQKIYEDEELLAFHDIHPIARVHFMIVPKEHWLARSLYRGARVVAGKDAAAGAEAGEGAGPGGWFPDHDQHRQGRRAGGVSPACSCLRRRRINTAYLKIWR